MGKYNESKPDIKVEADTLGKLAERKPWYAMQPKPQEKVKKERKEKKRESKSELKRKLKLIKAELDKL